MLEDFQLLRGDAWRGATTDDATQADALLQDALQKYQVGGRRGAGGRGARVCARATRNACKHPHPHPSLPACPLPQNPEAADKLAKILRDLDETKIILHKARCAGLATNSAVAKLAAARLAAAVAVGWRW